MARARLNSGDCSQDDCPKAKINRKSIRNIGKLLTYLKPYRLKFSFGFLFLVLSSLALLTLPALLGSMVDAAQGKQTLSIIPSDMKTIGIITFCILLFQSFISFFRIRLFVEVAERTLADIRKDTYFNLITLPMDFFANRRVGELNSRLSSDLSQIQDTMTTTFAEIIRQGILLIGGICFLFIVSIKLTMLNLAILPVVVIVAAFFGRFIRNLSRKAQDKLAESNTIVQETLQGISNVKAFVNEAYEAKRYANSLQAVVDLALKGASYRGLFASFILFCIFGTIVTVIWYGASLISTGELSVGSLTTYIISSLFVAGSMGSFPELYATVQKTLGSTERVIDILEEQHEDVSIHSTENAVTQALYGELAFEHVHFAYPSRKEINVLKGVSFSAHAGEKIAIVGPSGTGKSTLSALILRFYMPDKGEIYFDGRLASSYKLTDIRNQVAIVPQDVLLFGGSIRDNIAYGRLGASADDIVEAAKKANAHHFIQSFPEGYDTMVGERGVKLSGGQRQRIAIARALLKDPAILILDEATSSLDSESERLVQQALEELMKGRTSIIIAHRLSTIREADKIVVMDGGKVVECGTHNELLLNESGLYKYLSGLQQEQKVS